MTEHEQTLLMIKGVISELPKNIQAEIQTVAADLRAKVKANPHLAMAIALVGAELAAE